jgi:uncharacterized protein YbjT (DUF2867 family)
MFRNNASIPTLKGISMNKILITGASGNIGTPLIESLRSQGADFEMMRSKADSLGTARVASFADVTSLKAAFSGIDTLFILLPLVPNKVELAKNVADAAKSAGVKHLVRSSGAGADVQAGFSLPRLQGTIDKIFEDTGIASTFLRPAGFMQNYSGYMAGMVKGGTVYGATADAPQSLIDVRDIAAVAATVLTNPQAHAGKAYTLTGGDALTDSQRMQVLSDVLGRTVSFVEVSREAGRASMAQMGMPDSMVEWLDSLNALVSAGYASDISPDVQSLLGRAPIGFRRFVQDFQGAWL